MAQAWTPMRPPPSLPPPSLPQVYPIHYTKKRRLQEGTLKILKQQAENLNTSTNEILQNQNNIFSAYENEVTVLKNKLTTVEEQLRQSQQQINNQSYQIQVSTKNVDAIRATLNETKLENYTLKTQIDELQMRILSEMTSKEESVAYYKNLVKGLEKTAANAEEASCYMRKLHKLFDDYANGESVSDTDKKTDRLCAICMSEPANIVAKPCHHLEWCMSCAIEHFKFRENAFTAAKSVVIQNEVDCPRCKQSIAYVDYVYL